jgi:hypothetical protein
VLKTFAGLVSRGESEFLCEEVEMSQNRNLRAVSFLEGMNGCSAGWRAWGSLSETGSFIMPCLTNVKKRREM